MDSASRKEEKEKSLLVQSGAVLIDRFITLLKEKPNEPREIKKQYLQQMLHAIFFFGRVHKLPVEPGEFLPDAYRETYRSYIPAPFQQCNTHLPAKTPFSILLDYVTAVRNPLGPLNELLSFNQKLLNELPGERRPPRASEFAFRAAVIARCFYKDPQTGTESAPFYGASLSCKGWTEKCIMLGVSLLITWHPAVAYAVHHAGTGTESSILFPEGVGCEGFQIQKDEYEGKPPCGKCQQLFQNVVFEPPAEREGPGLVNWRHGNCAETEAFSKLLREQPGLAGSLQFTAPASVPQPYQAIERLFAESRQAIEEKLRERLSTTRFAATEVQVFEPQ